MHGEPGAGPGAPEGPTRTVATCRNLSRGVRRSESAGNVERSDVP